MSSAANADPFTDFFKTFGKKSTWEGVAHAFNSWSFDRCNGVQWIASSGTMATHCTKYIAPRGEILRGKHTGKQWKDVFPDKDWDYDKWKIVEKRKLKDVYIWAWDRSDGKRIASMMTYTNDKRTPKQKKDDAFNFKKNACGKCI